MKPSYRLLSIFAVLIAGFLVLGRVAWAETAFGHPATPLATSPLPEKVYLPLTAVSFTPPPATSTEVLTAPLAYAVEAHASGTLEDALALRNGVVSRVEVDKTGNGVSVVNPNGGEMPGYVKRLLLVYDVPDDVTRILSATLYVDSAIFMVYPPDADCAGGREVPPAWVSPATTANPGSPEAAFTAGLTQDEQAWAMPAMPPDPCTHTALPLELPLEHLLHATSWGNQGQVAALFLRSGVEDLPHARFAPNVSFLHALEWQYACTAPRSFYLHLEVEK